MSPLKGSEVPRIWTPPLRELTPETSLGFECIEFAREVLGVELFPWQRWLLIHALETVGDLDGEWHFRYRYIVAIVARQNGKTELGKVVAAYFLAVLGVGLIIGTAQELEQAEDTWEAVVDIFEDVPELAAEVRHVWRTNGAKRLQLTGGRDYRVKASTRRAGRGKSADLVFMDELREHQDWLAWSAISNTTLAREDALIWATSNAGDGTSVVLRHLRAQAHAALGDPDGICTDANATVPDDEVGIEDDALGIFEWSAPPGAEPSDRSAWAQANPSLGYCITERALAAAWRSNPSDEFKTECMCQWITASVDPPFPVGAWEAGTDPYSEIAPDSPLTFGVDVSDDRGSASIAVCGMRADREWHVELVAYRKGVGWLVDWFKERATARGGIRVAAQTHGAPVSSMAEIIGAIEGVELVECKGPDVAGWSGRFWDAVSALDPERDPAAEAAVPVRHRPQPGLDLAANIAATRPMGDGAWAWDRRKSLEDISPLVAATMAFGAATAVEEAPVRSAYEDRGPLFI